MDAAVAASTIPKPEVGIPDDDGDVDDFRGDSVGSVVVVVVDDVTRECSGETRRRV